MITQARKQALAKRFGVDCKLTDYSWVEAMDDDMAGTIQLYLEDMEWIRQSIGQQVDNCTIITGRETGIFINCNVIADVFLNNNKVGVTNTIIELPTGPQIILVMAPGYVPQPWAIQLNEGTILNTTIDLEEITAGRETGIFVSCNVPATIYMNNVSIGGTGEIITMTPGAKLLMISAPGYETKTWVAQVRQGAITNLQITLAELTTERDTGIFVDCNVSAEVFENNIKIGDTGQLIIMLPGTKALLIARFGYVPKTWAAQVTRGSITNIQITLNEAVAGRDTGLFIDCNVTASVYVDNEHVGNTGELIELQPGTRRIMLVKDGYTTETRVEQITTGRITNLQITMYEATGERETGIFVDCNVPASIHIDNVKIGNTGELITLGEGTKRLMISAPGYEPRIWTTQITTGNITNIQIQLSELVGTRATGVFVDCNVPADVLENNTKIGNTGEVIATTAGVKILTISATGYVAKQRTVQVTTGNIANLQLALEPVPIGSQTGISVSCNVPADVYVENVKIGVTGQFIAMTPGMKQLVITATGYEPKTWTVQVTDGNVTNVTITLTQTEETGVYIDSEVAAEVFENNVKIGNTRETIQMTPGVKTLTIKAAGYTTQTLSGVQVTSGNVTTRQVTLQPEMAQEEIEGENGVEYTVLIVRDGLGQPITSKPTTIALGLNQWYSIMVKNERETPWYGYTGVRLTDDSGHIWTHEPNKQYATAVAPGETKSIRTMVNIPTDTVLEGAVRITMLLRGYRTLSE